MNIKLKLAIKKIMCPISVIRHRIKHREGFLYIGKGTKIVNTENMFFGKNVSIMPDNMLFCHTPSSKLVLGTGVELGMYSRIGCLNYIEIGNNVITGPHVFIADYNHEYKDPLKPIKFQGNCVTKSIEHHEGGVHIGEDSWIGTNVVISGTISIGKHCVIGANSVVTHDIPDYSVAVGMPCKVIKRYNFELGTWEKIVNETD